MEDRTLLSAITVTTTLDDGSVGSLRWAVVQANASGGAETIDFAPALFNTPQTITLTQGQLELTDTSGTDTITGPAAGVTISGGGLSRVFEIDGGVTASISGMTITGGRGGNGGGLANYGGYLTLTNCTVSGNSVAARNGHGGGVYTNGGNLTLTNCTVSGNSASYGGGVSSYSGGTLTLTDCIVIGNSVSGSPFSHGAGVDVGRFGMATLSDCTISGNSSSVQGGGVMNYYSTATLIDCTVSGNSASVRGGGVYNTYSSKITLTNCTVSSNTSGSGGGIRNNGTATLLDCTVSGNTATRRSGGGMYNTGTTTLTDCTVSNNSSSHQGGGLSDTTGTTTLTNCTISGNSATDNGGGLNNNAMSTTILTNCTLSGNSTSGRGGGVSIMSGTVTLGNTIVAGNTASSSGPDVFGTVDSVGHNLIGQTDGSSGWTGSDLTGTGTTPLDPLLAPLGDYGGPTQTMALLPGSPAIGAGTAVTGITTDQRGQPADVPLPDIGAYQDRPGPYIVATADGQLQGWLGGSAPDTTFRIDVFASSAYNANGSGEEQDLLGSLMVTTDAAGQVSFAIPFAVPTGLPDVTATATDPLGNISDISALRQGVFDVPTPDVRITPGQPSLPFSAASGDAIALRDPDAGPLEPVWSLTLSVGAGTLTLSSTAGLTGSGDGTGSLSYSGPLSALDAALAGLTFTPSPAFHSTTTLSLDAGSYGASPIQAQVSITDGVFVVTTTADSGPGSLRQAILDSNVATGGTNTIDFAIPGTGIRTIAPGSPLPTITNPVLIDGTSQPGFAGTPLIDLTGQALEGSNPLSIASSVTVRGVTIDGFALGGGASSDVLNVASVPLPGSGAGAGGSIESYRFVATTDEELTVVLQAQGGTARLLLMDAGTVLMQSDGQSAADGADVISLYVPAGTYSLEVQSLGGAGTYRLTATSSLATNPLQPIGQSSDISSVISGDFNGDGHLDLAFTNANSDTVSVLLGNGDGTFAPQVNYAIGADPVAIVAGDFTGDGHLDLAVANFGVIPLSGDGTVSVLLGHGDGTFAPQVTYTVGEGPNAIVTGDFTGDGHVDLVVANEVSGTVSVLRADGDGTFAPQVTYPVGLLPEAIVAGDFSGDGHLDLAVGGGELSGTNTFTVSVLLGHGDGTFAPPVHYPVASGVLSMVAGDFTGDGHLDLAVGLSDLNGTNTSAVSVLLGHGDGTFAPPVHYCPVGDDPYGIVAGDFTGDGHLDLATANNIAGTVSVLLGHGDGTFAPPVHYPAGSATNGIVAGDFTGDGHLDLAVGGNGYSPVSVLLGNGDGTFRPLNKPNNEVGSFSAPDAIAVGDFTGDGHLDLAVANSSGDTVSVLLGNGNGTFQPQANYLVGSEPFAIVAGDFNGDGRTDLAVANLGSDTVSVLLGNGDGTFQPQVTYPVGGTLAPGITSNYGPYAMVAGDFNGDGRTDLAVANWGARVDDTSAGETIYGATVSVLLGNGDGTFAPQVNYPVGPPYEQYTAWYPYRIVAGDFTGDGHLDLAVTGGPFYGAGMVSVLLGHGDGTFAPPVHYPAGDDPFGIVAGDFTGNGHLDLAVANSGDETVSVLLGNGDGTFAPQVTYPVGSYLDGSYPAGIVAEDFTGNGHLDLAVTNEGVNTVSVLLGNGDGTFAPQVTYAVGSYPDAIVAGDFIGDGHLDLAVANGVSGTVSVLLGEGDGTFIDPGQLATTPYATPLVADVNGDGTDDVLVVDGAGHILDRQGIPGQPGSFEPPVTVNPGYPSRDIAWLPNTNVGPVLASADAQDNTTWFYAYRDGGFVRLNGSLSTGQFPAQILAADLNGTGLTDLVVRNAGDGTLSMYLGSRFRSGSFGPAGTLAAPIFTAAFLLPAGLGVSDVQVADPMGSGVLDLVVTNKLTGQVSLLRNLGGGAFAPAVPYRAGTGLYALDTSGGSPVVTSLEATSGVGAGVFTTGGPTDLVTINPGTETIGVLASLGNGRFADPVTLYAGAPPLVVRVADLTGNGLDDLAVLTAKGVSIYLANGKGGFLPPVTYGAGTDPTGLTVADLLGNGKLDLLVGNAYGDVLILVGNGDGTFRPFEPVKAAIALAVADLNGNGALDFVFADQSLNRVTVVYGSPSQSPTSPQVLGNQATGVLAPGAVLLHDMNGDGIPDLIVANSGGNNVLVYPGLGNGQFGPPINGTQGFPVGTDPTGLAVYNLNGQPDVLVADTGSNDVSVLLGQGSGSSWTMISGARVQTDAGPAALAVGNLLGGSQTDLAVANSGANNVQIFPGVGGGFFNNQPQATRTYAVGQAPSSLFLGHFNGLGQGLATLNSGSKNGTLISGIGTANPVTQSFPTGGDSPTAGFAGDFNGNGFTDLVVGNNGDGHLALLLGGSGGLSLSQTLSSAEAPNPTSLSFAGVSDGLLSFYVSTAGRDAALSLAFDLNGGTGSESEPSLSTVAVASSGESSLAAVLSEATSGSVQQVSQLLSFTGTTLNLAATLLTVSALPGNFESESSGAAASVGTIGLGQPVGQPKGNGEPSGSGEEPGAETEGSATGPPAAAETLPRWERLSIGLEEGWEQARAAIRELESRSAMAGGQRPSAGPAVSRPPRPPVAVPSRPPTRAGTETRSQPAASAAPIAPASATSDRGPAATGRVIDAALEDLGSERAGDGPSARERWRSWDVLAVSEHAGTARALVAVVASASVVGAVGAWRARWVRRRRLASSSLR